MTSKAKVWKLIYYVIDIIENLNIYSRLRSGKVHKAVEQLQLQSARLRLQLLLDKRLYIACLQKRKNCLTMLDWHALLLRRLM